MSDQYTAGSDGGEVGRLRRIISNLDMRHLGALEERNALQARIDRALELVEEIGCEYEGEAQAIRAALLGEGE